MSSNMPYVSISQIEFNEEEIGFGKIIFELDGLTAFQTEFDGLESNKQKCEAIIEG